jgi:REP element-mobilizing transposase RayT
MRKQPLITEQYYHIYNRGVDKRDIFKNKKDVSRFLESMVQFNRTEKLGSLRDFNKPKSQPAPKALAGEAIISIVAYCLNPNHFHFILKQNIDGGIAKFMQKLQAGYTSYFNISYKRSGALFQGTFKSQIIVDDLYFSKMIGYVNNNSEVHFIPQAKRSLISSSDEEYKKQYFKVVSYNEGKRVVDIFGEYKKFNQHCREIISAIRKERGKISLLEEDVVPASA